MKQVGKLSATMNLRAVIKPFKLGKVTKFVWDTLPAWALDLKPMRKIGHSIYDNFTRHLDRKQSHMTFFLRNMAQFEVVRDLIAEQPTNASLKIVSLGCSSGAELYSLLYCLRLARPDFQISAHGLDISEDITDIARRGIYDPSLSQREDVIVPSEGIDDVDVYLKSLSVLLDKTEENMLTVKDWVREGTSWSVGDATSPTLVDQLGHQDIVLANNFLGPMDDDLAEKCLRNIVRLVKPGGILVLDGVDLDLKARIVPLLDLRPITNRMEEIHHGDPTKGGWPWIRWSHEPFDWQRSDRDFRYSTVFVKPKGKR